MAITFIGKTDNDGASGSETVHTLSNHVVSGLNPALIVIVCVKSSNIEIPSVVFNTTESLTILGVIERNSNCSVALYYLPKPSRVTADVVITLDSDERAVVAAMTFAGVDQKFPIRLASYENANGSGANPTNNVADTLVDEMVIDVVGQISAGPVAAVGEHTETVDAAATGGGTDVRGASQRVLRTTSNGSQSMDWTITGFAEPWAWIGAALQEPSASGGGYVAASHFDLVSPELGGM